MDREVLPSSSAFWDKLVRGAMVARPEPTTPGRGWFVQLLLRLVLIAVVLVVLAGVAIYMVARSL